MPRDPYRQRSPGEVPQAGKGAWAAAGALGTLAVVALAAAAWRFLSPAAPPAATVQPTVASAPIRALQPTGQSALAVTSPSAAPQAPFAGSTPQTFAAPAREPEVRRETRRPQTHTRARERQPEPTPPQATAPATAFATPAAPPPCTDCATVESVTAQQHEGQANGLGAVVGGVLGGVLGNQVGGGNGRTAMTVIGALGGGLAGNEAQKRIGATTVYRVELRMDNGARRTLTVKAPPPTGIRVRVGADGTLTPLQ